MEQLTVFLDTDVIISSLLSRSGASYELITHTKVKKIISTAVKKEVIQVSKRHGIEPKKATALLKNIKIFSINLSKEHILKSYSKFVFDNEDSHVVVGAQKSGSNILLTHNTKHYNITKIKNDLDIVIMKPGNFLQYLRGREKAN